MKQPHDYDDALKGFHYVIYYLKHKPEDQISKLKEYARKNVFILLIDTTPEALALNEKLLADGEFVDEILSPIILTGVYKKEKLHFSDPLFWSIMSIAKHSPTFSKKRELIALARNLKDCSDSRPPEFHPEWERAGVPYYYRCYDNSFRSILKTLLK